MQVGRVSWVGQTFALARCSDSQGKKPRSRRTKEERRKMVESFIKRYRDSNYGNFPSLNLTHKEVGGSFYTVREIVREIIQENKVLRPGSLNSQAFSLDDCSEQHLPDHDTTNSKGEFTLHSYDILVPRIIDGDLYEEQHWKNLHNVNSTNEKSGEELIELSAHGQNYLPTQADDEPCAEDEDKVENLAKCETDDPIGFSQPLSVSSTIGILVPKDTKSDIPVNDMNKVIYSSVEGENAFKVDYVCDKLGNLPPSGHPGGSSRRHTGEQDPLHSTGITDSGSEQISTENTVVLDISELSEVGVIASKNASCMPDYSDPTLNSMECLSFTTVDQNSVQSVKAPIMKLADCPTYESKNLQVEPPNLHMEVATSISGRASGEAGLEGSISNSSTQEKPILDGTNRESSEAREKTEDAEINPLLAIIKGLVSAFIKFWTE